MPRKKYKVDLYVDTVTDAILRVLEHSSNMTFIEECCRQLQITTLHDSKVKLTSLMWNLLHKQQGIAIPKEIVSNQLSFNRLSSNSQEIMPVAINPANNISLATNILEETEDTSSHSMEYLLDFYHPEDVERESYIGSDCFNRRNNIYLEDSEDPFLALPSVEDAKKIIDSVLQKSSYCVSHVSSTPDLEKPSTCVSSQPMNDESNTSCEIMRSYNDMGEDVFGSSWESFTLASFKESSFSDPSINFSKPECLNESQLLYDLLVAEGQSGQSIAREDEISLDPQPSSSMEDGRDYSMFLVDSALKLLSKSLISDNGTESYAGAQTITDNHYKRPQRKEKESCHVTVSANPETFTNISVNSDSDDIEILYESNVLPAVSKVEECGGSFSEYGQRKLETNEYDFTCVSDGESVSILSDEGKMNVEDNEVEITNDGSETYYSSEESRISLEDNRNDGTCSLCGETEEKLNSKKILIQQDSPSKEKGFDDVDAFKCLLRQYKNSEGGKAVEAPAAQNDEEDHSEVTRLRKSLRPKHLKAHSHLTEGDFQW